ncbi:unnamed protein product [Nezara viridula]|uniref:Gustatory receptor n=1 Tax=Nezara viridula TaxID=85310 RepID=A0A9P0E6B6_NEZVI|nr:unnamed protein product [Nezara viridula]
MDRVNVSSTMVNGVHNALSLILAMSKAFGAFTMRAKGETFVFSCKLVAYFIVLTIGAVAVGIFEIYDLSRGNPISLPMIIEIFVFCFNTLTSIIVLYLHYRLRESLPAIISELDDMDKLIGNVSYNRHYNYGVIFLSILNALPAVFALVCRPFLWIDLIMWIVYYFFTITTALIVGQYAILLHILSRQLHMLSVQLNTVICKLKVWSLIEIHHSLVLLADRINRAYDIFLFHMITFTFVINIMKLYFVIVYIVKPVSYTNLELMTISVADFLFNCGCFIIIVFAAMEATNSVRK